MVSALQLKERPNVTNSERPVVQVSRKLAPPDREPMGGADGPEKNANHFRAMIHDRF
jgi:hypothetical protein